MPSTNGHGPNKRAVLYARVSTDGVSVVLAQDRDRFAREPAYHYLLRREFEERGTAARRRH